MFQFFFVFGCFVIALIVFAMLLLLSGDGAREQKLMVFILCGSLLQNAGYLMEMTASGVEVALMAVKVQYLGSTFVPLLYCCFIFIYCYQKIPGTVARILAALDVVILAFVLTLDMHTFYYRDIEWRHSRMGHSYMHITPGPVYFAFLIFSCGVPFLMSIYILLKGVVTMPDHAQNRQYRIIMWISFLPFLALLLYAAKLTGGYDPTPAILGLMLSLVEILVWSRRNYDFRHLAAAAVLQSMSGGVIALDDRRRIVSYNRAAENIFEGLNPQVLGDFVDKVWDLGEEVLEEDRRLSLNIRDRYYETQTKRIYSDKGALEGYAVLILDVTDTRNYIEEIKRVREQAEQANVAKSEFLANMSHEIRTPMNAITGLSDIIIEESRGRKLYTYARDIKAAAQNLLAIINDILDLSKVEAGKMELITADYYVKAAVGEILGMMDIAASQHGLVMKHEYDLSIPCMYNGDVGRIKQILINLLNNAIKFTQAGYVKLSLSGHPGEKEGEEILIFQVEDTGCGIRRENLEKIFENFKQLDSKRNRSVEGTGLGLSITKRLVELMGGSISVESVYGKGSTFTVMIPQKIVDARTLEEVPDVPVEVNEQTQMFTAAGYKVLLVDDNLVNRKVAKRLLESYRFMLTEAASGPEAIELVKKERYDMIFMDHMMPEMDGIEAVQIIRSECGENGTEPIIIALTANAMAGIRERFLSSGFQDFVPKPLDRKDLNLVLGKWIPDERKTTVESGPESAEDAIYPDEVQIRGIDTNAILEQYTQLADYKEILALYCVDSERKLGLLRQLAEEKDYKNYEIEVHALKSASANIGAMEISDLAREHELAAARGNESYVQKNYGKLLRIYASLVKNIRIFLENSGRDEDDGKERPVVEGAELIRRVEEALGYLERFRSKECAKEIEDLLSCQLDNASEKSLKEIEQQLKLYEDDKAEQMLHELLEALGEEE